MEFKLTIFFLLVVAYALLAIRLGRWLITMPIFFVVAGALLGDFTANFSFTIPAAEAVTEVTLALLLFADASTLSFKQVARERRLPARLLMVGLPLSIALGGLLALVLLRDQDVWTALLLAAILAPTDAALGLAIFNNKRVPVGIRRSLNVESGLNDGIVAPFVTLFLALSLAAGEQTMDPFLLPAIRQIGVGLIVAVVAGVLGGKLFALSEERRWSSPSTRLIGGLALALATFVGSVSLGGNGFIAAFVAGLLFGRTAGSHAAEIVELTESGGTLLSLVVWTLFGTAIVPTLLAPFDVRALIFAILALTVMRMLPVAIALHRTGLRRDTVALMGWFGPRGLASVVFVLIAVEAFHEAGLVFDDLAAAAGWTILLSVVLHGVSAAPLARWYARRLQAAPSGIPEVTDVPEVSIRRSGDLGPDTPTNP